MPDSPSPTRDHVLKAVAQDFPAEDPATVLGILAGYGPERHHRERERVHLAILALSGGDLDELRTLVTYAKRDYRDVLYWTELAKGHRDPFADRFTETLRMPGATPRRLTLLKEAVPEAARMAVLWGPGYVSREAEIAELEATARGLAVALQPIRVRRSNELDSAFETMRSAHAEALLILTSTMLHYHWRGIADRARMSRIPAMGELREFPVAGGLMSYGLSAADRQEQAVGVMDRLVKTLKRQDAAHPRPSSASKLDLVINLKTATALGLTIPQSVLVRADEVID